MKQSYLIIGGSKGIGKALVDRIASEGHQAIVVSRKINGLTENDNIQYIQGDVLGQLPDIDTSLHGIAYCPGSIQLKPFKSLDQQAFQQDFAINVLGAVASIQKYLPNLKQVDNSSIVLFSTVAVQMGMPFHSSISASKGAIEGLTRSLAAELAPKIRVNAIAPSMTDTDLAANLLRNDKMREASANRHPLKKIGEPEDIAAAAWFALSSQYKWSTGQVIHVDGGLSSTKTL